MTYKELKKFCDEKIKEFPELERAYKKEIIVAKRFYDNGRNLFEELMENREQVVDGFIIPALLGIREIPDEEGIRKDYVQVKPGASGGIDIDSDFAPKAKESVTEYVRQKYGADRVLSVGTYTRLGVSSAAKDLLRIHKIDFKESNFFTSALDSNSSWEENIERMRGEDITNYQFYTKHKEILDLVPKFVNKVRQAGKHAGGLVILDRPVWEIIPVEKVQGFVVSAFPESAQHQVLDELGVIKFDILGITILDVIDQAVSSIDEKLYMIEDNDGIVKIVPESYIDKELENV